MIPETLETHLQGTRVSFSDLAVREINHRIANTLSILIAGLRADFRDVEDPYLRSALRRHESHIFSIGELHRLLGVEPGGNDCAIAPYFEQFCCALARSVLAPLNVKCDVYLSEGTLPAATCAKLALAICELVMNAAKHAFSDKSAGRVRIDVLRENDYCRCIVSDNGWGLGTSPTGTGARIVNQLVCELGGVLQVQSGSWGTDVSVLFPI